MLKNLKSLFIVEEETTEKPAESSITPESTPVHLPSQTITPVDISEASGVISERLMKAVEENNQSGFDYFEYRSALKTMEKMPMDEATRFQSTFATASTLGVTREKLVESAEFYLKVLANEETKFLSASEQQFKTNIDKKIEEIEMVKKLIEDKNEQIRKLNEEIQLHYQRLEGLNSHITESKSKIELTQKSFENAYIHIKNEILADMEKMNKYLK